MTGLGLVALDGCGGTPNEAKHRASLLSACLAPLNGGGSPADLALVDSALSTRGDAGRHTVLSLHRQPIEDSTDAVVYAHLCETTSGEPDKIAVWERTGEVLSEPEVQQRAVDAQRAQYGKLGKRLYARLSTLPPGERVRVQVWHPFRSVGFTPAVPLVNLTAEEVDAVREARRQSYDGANFDLRNAARAAVDQVAPGAQDTVSLKSLPVVVATLDRTAIETLARNPDVMTIELPPPPQRKLSAGYLHYEGADDMEVVEDYTSHLYWGQGMKVGLLGIDARCSVYTAHPDFQYLDGYHTSHTPDAGLCAGKSEGAECWDKCGYQAKGICRSGTCYKEHGTGVASAMGSYRDYEGNTAFQMQLYDANGSTYEQTFAQRLDWLVQQGVTVINNSEGPTSQDNGDTSRWPAFNFVAREYGISIAKAVGNDIDEDGSFFPFYTDCPDNALCVGGYLRGASPSTVDHWKIDPFNTSGTYSMWQSSTWRNHTMRWDTEKPDVVGPLWDAYASPSWAAPYAETKGTSLAAPRVAGLIALWQQETFWLRLYQETVRAIAMTNAVWHNVEGGSLSRNWYHLDPGDEKDGAGVVIARASSRASGSAGYMTRWFTNGDFNANGDFFWKDVTVPAGATIRSVLSWSYCTEGSYTYLKADFDLVLRDKAAGSSLDYSNSYNSSNEMVQWKNTGATSKVVTLQVKKGRGPIYSCGGTTGEIVGIAYHIHSFQGGHDAHAD